MADIQHAFFTAPKYAVAGASNNASKFGYILLQWYHSRGIPVTPVTPTSTEILGVECVSDVAKLSDKSNTSLSIVTPPKVTRGILEQVLQEGELNAIWLQVSLAFSHCHSFQVMPMLTDIAATLPNLGALQPGAEDGDVVDYIKSNQWLKERTVYGGPCVLVLGDKLRKDVAQGKL